MFFILATTLLAIAALVHEALGCEPVSLCSTSMMFQQLHGKPSDMMKGSLATLKKLGSRAMTGGQGSSSGTSTKGTTAAKSGKCDPLSGWSVGFC